jgi:hypothetical protein
MPLPVKGMLCRSAPLTGLAVRLGRACDGGSGGMQTFQRERTIQDSQKSNEKSLCYTKVRSSRMNRFFL